MKATVYNQTGKKMTDMTLDESMFGHQVNQSLLAEYVRVYRHRQRQAASYAQNRAVITGTTAKVWRQKGTGRARHGSRKAPIFVGGGKAHGPDGSQNYKLSLPKKKKKAALSSALAAAASKVAILKQADKFEAKTKSVSQWLDKTGLTGKILLVLDKSDHPLVAATANIDQIQATQAKRLNVFELLQYPTIVMTQESLEILSQRLGRDKKTEEGK